MNQLPPEDTIACSLRRVKAPLVPVASNEPPRPKERVTRLRQMPILLSTPLVGKGGHLSRRAIQHQRIGDGEDGALSGTPRSR